MQPSVKVVENLKEGLGVHWMKLTVVSKTFVVLLRTIVLKILLIDRSTTMTVACLNKDIRRLTIAYDEDTKKMRTVNRTIDVRGKSEEYRVVWSMLSITLLLPLKDGLRNSHQPLLVGGKMSRTSYFQNF